MEVENHISLFRKSLENTRFEVIEMDGICNNRILQIREIFDTGFKIVRNTGKDDFNLNGELMSFINTEYAIRRDENKRKSCSDIISILKRIIREERFKEILDK